MTAPLVKANMVKIHVSARGFSQEMKRAAREGHKEAVREWVKAVIAKIPVYTGTARGTYAVAGRKVNLAVAAMSKNTSKTKFIYPKGGTSYPLGWKVALGGAYSKATLDSRYAEMGEYEYIFKFEEWLPYVVWNNMRTAPEWLHLIHQTPWTALEAGAAAYRRYALSVLPKRLPDPRVAVKFTKFQVR